MNIMETKICSKCKEEKNVSEYYKSSKNPKIYRGICKVCMNIQSKEYKINNFENVRKKNKEYELKNKESIKQKKFEYRKNNPNLFKKWLEKNKKHRRDYIKNYNSIPLNKLKNSLRSRINKLMNEKYNSPRTFEILGCDFDFLKQYIENKFTEGMTWDNYGYYGWHIDHIIPVSHASSELELLKLCHYTNLQPLWAKENLSKNNKIL